MQMRAIIFTVIGALLASASMFGAYQYVNSAGTDEPGFVKVLIASTDIPFGEPITRELLAAQDWPEDSLPDGAFISTRDLLGPDGIAPRRATQPIPAGDLILDKRVSDFGESVTIVRSLGENTRAMAIQVDSVTAVGGFVMPGDRVDVVLTEGRGADLRAATILQDVRVLSTDQELDKQGAPRRGEVRTITVEVTARDGQILALAQRAGVLSLALRTRNGVSNEALDQITLADVLKNDDPFADAPAVISTQGEQGPKHTIRVRRGVDEEEVELK